MIKQGFETVYKQVYNVLERYHFLVVLEPDIGKNLSRFAQHWGEGYKRNNLERIRSMVFCNGWYANRMGNADPEMLALCPLRISLTYEKGSYIRVVC